MEGFGTMKRNKFVITENAEQKLLTFLLSESFIPKAELVLKIKDYLDKNFAKQLIDDIEDGYPKKIPTVSMLSVDKQPLKTMQISELLLLLDDKFHSVIKDDNDRKKFLKQVIIDWFVNKIGNNGILSKNYL